MQEPCGSGVTSSSFHREAGKQLQSQHEEGMDEMSDQVWQELLLNIQHQPQSHSLQSERGSTPNARKPALVDFALDALLDFDEEAASKQWDQLCSSTTVNPAAAAQPVLGRYNAAWASGGALTEEEAIISAFLCREAGESSCCFDSAPLTNSEWRQDSPTRAAPGPHASLRTPMPAVSREGLWERRCDDELVAAGCKPCAVHFIPTSCGPSACTPVLPTGFALTATGGHTTAHCSLDDSAAMLCGFNEFEAELSKVESTTHELREYLNDLRLRNGSCCRC